MKKAFLIFCIFYITNFFFCNAQVDTQVDTLAIPVDMQVDTLVIQVDSLVIQDNANKLTVENKIKKRAPIDSLQLKRHNPKKASWLAIVPGAGQIYNKKYWKLPIVYCGLGATAFLIYYYADLTAIYRKEYVKRVNDPENQNANQNPKLANLPTANILETRNFYRRNMEICVAACTVIYLLSILDACVDAHLYYYDISDNLAVGIKPKLNYNPITGGTAPGMGLIVKF